MKHTRTYYGAFAALCGLVALAAYRFIPLGFPLAFPDFGEHLAMRRWAFVSHVAISPVALLIGALQFSSAIRQKRPYLHRRLGRLYVIAVLLGGIGGFVLAIEANGGLLAGAGFALLAVLWIACTWKAYLLARARRYGDHRRWMIRSFALTFAAVTLRLYLLGFMAAGIGYTPASVYLGWICWLPNLLVAEWWLRRSTGRHIVTASAGRA